MPSPNCIGNINNCYKNLTHSGLNQNLRGSRNPVRDHFEDLIDKGYTTK